MMNYQNNLNNFIPFQIQQHQQQCSIQQMIPKNENDFKHAETSFKDFNKKQNQKKSTFVIETTKELENDSDSYEPKQKINKKESKSHLE